MRLLNTKKITFLSVCVLTFLVFSFCLKTSNGERTNLSSLNSKYGLIAAEPLGDNNKDYSSLSYMFNSDISKVSVLDIFKPEKELIVKLESDSDLAALGNIFLLRLRTNADPQEIAKQYELIDGVSYAEPNFQIELSDYDDLGPEDDVNISGGSKVATDLSVIVAVIDSGVDIKHKDLEDRIVLGYNFVSGNENVSDGYGHGTHVAGIIASNSSAKIMPIKFTDGKKGKMSDLAKAIKFAVDNDAGVINLSLGLSEKSSLLKNFIDYAFKNNIPIVAAAGNYNTSKKYYPAAYSKVIAVAGLANDDTKLPQSNFGSWVDYSVKAQDISSTMPGDNYGYATGTSQAAPFVSAEIVKILENTKDSSIKSILLELDKNSTPLNTGKFAWLLGKELE